MDAQQQRQSTRSHFLVGQEFVRPRWRGLWILCVADARSRRPQSRGAKRHHADAEVMLGQDAVFDIRLIEGFFAEPFVTSVALATFRLVARRAIVEVFALLAVKSSGVAGFLAAIADVADVWLSAIRAG